MSEKFRIEKKSNFTVVSNDILMNNYMSMKATCLLMKMHGKPDNWACVTYHRARKMIQRRLEETGSEE